jgi:outer membrane biogenesis lipoprotein LolB
MIRNLVSIALLTVCLILTGCGLGSSISTRTVNNDQDWFTQEVDGRKVEYRNWTITIDDKTIPIEKKKSVIEIVRKGGKIDIFVNGQQVHDE